MSSTSSEDKADGYESVQKSHDTVEYFERGAPIGNDRDEERDRKRRRISASEQAREMEREIRMERYAKARIREIDSTKRQNMSEGPSRHRNVSSRGPSRSRSEEGSRSKSPAASRMLPPARVGKRLRRAPQRWDGERKEPRPTRTATGASSKVREIEPTSARDSDGEPTLSANSFQYEPEAPALDHPVLELQKAVAKCGGELNRRTIVDTFHTWQLQAVSKQAAQQKALHVFLKRKLRKRTTRAPEIERLEEDALRNSRNATFKSGEEKSGHEAERYQTTVEDVTSKLVPSKLRLPLEAYLPRRARASKSPKTPEDILKSLPPRPHLPGLVVEEDEDGSQKWLNVPTVSTSSLLNRQKNGSKYNKLHAVKVMRKMRDGDRARHVDE